jgi:hypothetical protein
MNLRVVGLFLGVAAGALATVVVACSGGTTCEGAGCAQLQGTSSGTSGTSGTSGQSSSGTSGPRPPPPPPPPQPPPPPGGACLPQAGSYTETFTASAGNTASCPTGAQLSSNNFTFNPSELSDAGPGCSVTQTGCETKVHCVTALDGGTSTIDEDVISPGPNATSFNGTVHVVSTGATAQNCTYTLTAVKN